MQIFGGLLVFMGYVLFDTQMIIERANRGDYNYVKHALDLFVDFVAIFVRLLVIMVSHYSKAFWVSILQLMLFVNCGMVWSFFLTSISTPQTKNSSQRERRDQERRKRRSYWEWMELGQGERAMWKMELLLM